MSSNALHTASDSHALDDEQLKKFTSEGVVLLPGRFNRAEMNDLGDESLRVIREQSELVDEHNLRTRFTPHHLTGVPLFEKFDPFIDLSPLARSIVHDARILQPLASIYGEAASLFKDKLIFKPPGATGASLHQDWISWPGFPESFLTVLVAIDPFTSQNGATEFYVGGHKRGYLSAHDAQHHHLTESQFEQPPRQLLMEPGDVAIFSGFIPHRSAPNHSAASRRGYFISYNAMSDGGEQYASHYQAFHQWLRDKTPEPSRGRMYFQ